MGADERSADEGWFGELRPFPSVRGSVTWSSGPIPFESSLAISTGYRLPSYAELFWPAGGFAVGNPELQPERSSAAELELRLGRAGASEMRLNGYATLYRNLIQWLPDPTGYWRPRNTGRAITAGAELSYGGEVALGLSPWNVGGELSGEMLFARDRNDGPTYNKQLPYRPEYSGSLATELTHLAGHRLRVELRGVGARPVTRQNTRWLDPYMAIDLSTELSIPGTPVVLRGRVDNLLDRDFTETRFFPNPGREILVETEVSW